MDSSGHSGISVGTPFSGQISYANNIPVIGGSSWSATYAPVDISLSMAGENIDFFSGRVAVVNDGLDDPDGLLPFWDYVSYFDTVDGLQQIAGEVLTLFQVTIAEPDGDAINNTNLITSLDTLNSNFQFKTLGLSFADEFNVFGSVLLEPVPVPASVWLFGSGLLGLIGISRKKKAA